MPGITVHTWSHAEIISKYSTRGIPANEEKKKSLSKGFDIM
jgi:hypothetical protein